MNTPRPQADHHDPAHAAEPLNPEETLRSPGRHEPAAASVFLALALVVATIGAVGVVTAVMLLRSPETTTVGLEILALAAGIAAGLTACGLLLGLAVVVRRLVHLADQVSQLAQHTAIRAEQAAARANTPAISESQLDTLINALGEIQELLLLPEAQRERRFRALAEREIETRLATARAMAACRDFHRARRELALLMDRFGPDERITRAKADIEEATRQAQETDIESARDEIKNLVNLAQWDKAERMARELADKYPDAGEPLRLIEYVCRERQLYEQRHRARLHAQIQKYVHERRWQEAAEAARRFITTFPVGPDTDALRSQLETLEANAEIQTRQQMEEQIKEHIRRQEYWDALAIARRIIADYPFSPQANALRGQLARLEEMARRSGR